MIEYLRAIATDTGLGYVLVILVFVLLWIWVKRMLPDKIQDEYEEEFKE